MRGKEVTAFAKGKIATDTAFTLTRTNEHGTPFHFVEAASRVERCQAGGASDRRSLRLLTGIERASATLGCVHLLVDIRAVLAAIAPADAIDRALDDVLVMLLGIVETVEVADRNADDERKDELHHE
jgi:hypothetical protein